MLYDVLRMFPLNYFNRRKLFFEQNSEVHWNRDTALFNFHGKVIRPVKLCKYRLIKGCCNLKLPIAAQFIVIILVITF